jgi:hypothetical protein
VKRLLALAAAGFGLRALLRRRSAGSRGPASPPASPSAADLRAKLDEARSAVDDAATPAAPADAEVEARRADVHERARKAIDDLGE